MKGKEEASKRMLYEIEASQLSDIQFKAMVIRKLNELDDKVEKKHPERARKGKEAQKE